MPIHKKDIVAIQYTERKIEWSRASERPVRRKKVAPTVTPAATT